MEQVSKNPFLHIRLGLYLAGKQLKRSSKGTTALIIFVMMLTFLNLTVASGILLGLVEGVIASQRTYYSGDIFITAPNNKYFIENSPRVMSIVSSLPEYQSLSGRYVEVGSVEANYENKIRQSDKGNVAEATLVGINPENESQTSSLPLILVEGEYLTKNDFDKVLIGVQYLRQYQDYDAPGFVPLRDVHIGSKVRIYVNGISREVTVKGFIKGKVDQVDRVIYFVDDQLKSMIGRNDNNVDEIAVKLKPGSNVERVKQKILATGIAEGAKVQTYKEAQSKFIKDVNITFSILGYFTSVIAIAVASITVFIVIFINAITRRKQIGILKGIGIHSEVVKFAYIFQALFYAVIGVAIGLVILFVFLQPYFTNNPIDFPLSNGVLVATIPDTLLKVVLLFFCTLIAGYVPASLVVRQRTLDAILGK